MERTGLNAKVIFIANNRIIKQVEGQFIESLPINSKLTVYEEINDLPDDAVVVVNNRLVFSISQKIVKKHPLKKEFESCEYILRFNNYLSKLDQIQQIIQ